MVKKNGFLTYVLDFLAVPLAQCAESAGSILKLKSIYGIIELKYTGVVQ